MVHAYDHEPDGELSFGLEAAAKLGVEPGRVFKTLLAETDRGLVVAIVSVRHNLDLKAVAAAIGSRRATMAEPAAAEKATGYVVGGISPLGQRRRLPTVADDEMLGRDTVFISAGRRGLEIELAPADLIDLTGATLARIRRER